MALQRKQLALIFLLLWFHVSLLDLFFVNFSGPVFLWAENLKTVTLVTHFMIAAVATGMFWLIAQLKQHYQTRKIQVSEKVWALCSLLLLLSIGFLLT